MPTQELLTAMGAFNESLIKAGFSYREGLKPRGHGKRVHFSGMTRRFKVSS